MAAKFNVSDKGQKGLEGTGGQGRDKKRSPHSFSPRLQGKETVGGVAVWPLQACPSDDLRVASRFPTDKSCPYSM